MKKEEVELRKEFMEKGAKLVSKLMVGGVFFYFFFLFSHCTARGSSYPYMYTLQLHFFPHPLFCCNMSI